MMHELLHDLAAVISAAAAAVQTGVLRVLPAHQVVLEVLETRVSIGSAVYESDHIVILGWLDNQRDEEVLWKLLSQVRMLTLLQLQQVQIPLLQRSCLCSRS